MSLLAQLDPLKSEALAALAAATDLPALEQTKGAFLGGEGKRGERLGFQGVELGQ